MARKASGKHEFGADGLEDASTAFFTRALRPPVGPVTDPGRAHPHATRASSGGCYSDPQVSGRASRGACPTRAEAKRRQLPRRRG